MKTASVLLTSAIVIGGELIRRGTIVTIGEDAAKDLLRRGKAEVATAEDEPEPEAEDEPEEPAKPSGSKKK